MPPACPGDPDGPPSSSSLRTEGFCSSGCGWPGKPEDEVTEVMRCTRPDDDSDCSVDRVVPARDMPPRGLLVLEVRLQAGQAGTYQRVLFISNAAHACDVTPAPSRAAASLLTEAAREACMVGLALHQRSARSRVRSVRRAAVATLERGWPAASKPRSRDSTLWHLLEIHALYNRHSHVCLSRAACAAGPLQPGGARRAHYTYTPYIRVDSAGGDWKLHRP